MEHEEFKQTHKGSSHITTSWIKARRIDKKAGVQCDEAQMEIYIETTKIGGCRTLVFSTSFILSPEQARRFALAIAPELSAN